MRSRQADSIQDEISRLEREIYALKASARIPSRIKGFSFELDFDQGSGDYLITYADGKQPIITEAYTFATTTFSSPIEDLQKVYIGGQSTATIMFFSTRPILSIVKQD